MSQEKEVSHLYLKDVDRAIAEKWRVWEKWTSTTPRNRLMGTVVAAGPAQTRRLVEIRWDDGTVSTMEYRMLNVSTPA